MADCYINLFLDKEQETKMKDLGLGAQIKDIGGKRAVQVLMSDRDKKKLQKGYPGLEFDDSDACVLPEEAEKKLMNIIFDLKSLDVMKFAITKLYNPLAGKDLRSKTF